MYITFNSVEPREEGLEILLRQLTKYLKESSACSCIVQLLAALCLTANSLFLSSFSLPKENTYYVQGNMLNTARG